MSEENTGPNIIPSGGEMGNIYEMIPFNITFIGENVDRVTNMEILSFRSNIGVTVDKKLANIKGRYEDSFTFNNNLFYIQNDEHKQAKKFYELEAEDSDIYLWIPPKAPEIFEYVVKMDYVTSGDEGGTISGSITQTLYHNVLSNYTYFAQQVRKLIDIRKEAYYGRN